MSNERDRVISITLTEAEWRAFIARHPEPVDWLREQIRRESVELQEGTLPVRQSHFEDRSSRDARDRQPSVVALDDRLDDRQPQPASA
jgi:hypothetical protein